MRRTSAILLGLGVVVFSLSPLSNSFGQGGDLICNFPTCAIPVGMMCYTLGSYPAVQAGYTNNSNFPLKPLIVFDVVHNSTGQTVSYSTATLDIGPGDTGFAYPVVFGLSAGNYTEMLFALTTIGTKVSPTTSLNCSL